MVWSPEMTHYGCEAAKIAPLIVPYVQGRALDIGSGPGKAWPRMIGIDPDTDNGKPITDITADGTNLSLFADASCDAVFSSHFIEDVPRDRVPAVLAEWTRVIKPGGHLVLYVPSANLYPLVGEEHANTDHQWNIYPGDLEGILRENMHVGEPHGWDLILSEERSQREEYSILIVARKTADAGTWRETLWERNPGGRKRALVIRYGAIGDAVVCASILGPLKKQGYHVTLNTQPRIEEVLRHDPNIDEWLLQATDFVPNQHLGPYWAGLAERYDHVVNLSESVEGLMLGLPGRLNHSYSDGARKRIYDSINYLEHTHNIADVPHDFSGSRFYPTAKEREWAKYRKHKLGGGHPVVVWTVNGSSVHKVYPFTQIVCRWLIERTPCHIVLYGDPGIGRELAEAIIKVLSDDGVDAKSRITNIAGKWSIRESLTFAIGADVVIGPETGPLNSVSMEDVPKIIYLSHSSAQNLTEHWRNTVTLTPDVADVPCFPCHRLHYDWSHCRQDKKTGAALCASNIRPERIFQEIARCLGALVMA